MPDQLDPKLAERLASSAISRLDPPDSGNVLCTRRALKRTIQQAAQEAYEIGVLAGQKDRLGKLTRPGSPDRPTWMDIRLDDADELAQYKIRFKPVVLKSLLGAGYRCLGDLRWVPNRELTQFHYIGLRTAQQIRGLLRTFEHLARSSGHEG